MSLRVNQLPPPITHFSSQPSLLAANGCKSALYKISNPLPAMKHRYNISLCIILLLFFAVSCSRPDNAQVEDVELGEHLRELFPLHLSAPDSLLVLLDEIWSENEQTMSVDTKVRYYNLRGIAYQRLRRLEESQAALSQALLYSENDPVRQIRIMNAIAGNYAYQGNLQEALTVFQQSRMLLGDYQDTDLLFVLYLNIANVFSLIGDIDSALHYTQLAVNIAREVSNRMGEASGLINLGTLFMIFENFSEAEQVLRKAMVIIEESDEITRLWLLYKNLATVLIGQNKIEEALFYAQKSNDIAASIGMPAIAMHKYYAHRGRSYLAAGNYRRSLEMFYQALELRTIFQDRRFIAESHNALGLVYAHLGDFDRAVFYAKKALEAAQAQNFYRLQLDIYRNFLFIYAASGDMDNFLVTLEVEQALRNSLFTEQNARALHEMQVRYETEINQLLIAQQRQNIYRQYTIITILAITGILVLILSLIIIISQRRRMQNIKRIVQQYEAIKELKKERQKKADTSASLSEQSKKELIVSEMSERLMPEIERLFNEEKIYKRQGLTIDTVAKMLNTNHRYLSIVINECYQTTFPEFVKTFRIDEMIEMFKELHENGKYANYTLQAIAEEAGFIGKNTFYSAFKEVTGVTPTGYLKTLRGDNN